MKEVKNVKIVAEPERIIKIFSTALLYKSSPIIDSVVANLTEKGMIIKDSSLQVLAIYSIFPKHYFLDYNVEGEDKLVVTKSLMKMVKQGFKGADTITITKDKGKIVVKSRSAVYAEPIPDVEEMEFPAKIKKDEELGIFLPENFVPDVVLVLKADELSDLMSTDHYNVIFADNKLRIGMEDVGSYTKIITPIKILKSKEGAMAILDGDMFQRILANVAGEIFFAFNSEAAIVERISKEYVQVFMLAAIAPAPATEEVAEEGGEATEEKLEIEDFS